jgi:hypothetical protein
MQYKNKRILFLFITTIALIAMCFSILPVSAAEGTVEDPLLYDLSYYAKEQGITLDEAVQRYNIREAFDGLGAKLRDNEEATFAGLYVQHSPEYRIVVLFTRDSEKTIKNYVSQDLMQYVKPATAKVTLKQLRQNQAEALDLLEPLNLKITTGINIYENRVEIRAADADWSLLDNLQKDKALQLPLMVKVVKAPCIAEPNTDIYGGLAPGSGISYGTLGFSVINSVGTKGVTTAGHVRDDETFAGYSLPLQLEAYYTYYDAQWHTAPNFTVVNKIQWQYNGTTRNITGKKSWWSGEQEVGDYIFKFGRSTGYSGAYIASLYDTVYWVPNCQAVFVRVHNDYVSPVAANGDSGGPWFLGNDAYGTTSGSEPYGDDAWYTAVDFIEEGLSVTILTN